MASFVLRADGSVELASPLGQAMLSRSTLAAPLRSAFHALASGEPFTARWLVRTIELSGKGERRVLVEISTDDEHASEHPSARLPDRLQDWGLSQREGDVLHDLALGLSNKEIALRLGLAEVTVEAHLTRIFTKVGVRTRGGLLAKLL